MQKKTQQKLTLNVSEACALLGVSRPTVNAYIHRRDNPLPCIATAQGRGGRYIIPRAALEQWLLDEADRCAVERPGLRR